MSKLVSRYILKLDKSRYFYRIDPLEVVKIIDRKVKDARAARLAKSVVLMPSRRPRRLSVEHRGYTAIQSDYNLHVMICKDGRMKMHSQCDRPMTEDGLREMIDNYLEISGKLAGIYDDEEEPE